MPQEEFREKISGDEGGTPSLPFLSSLAGEPVSGDVAGWISRIPRLRKYLFYEMILSPDIVRRYRHDPEFSDDLKKAMMWYGHYRSLIERNGRTNPELDDLCREKGVPPLGWKDWNADRTIFLKGLSWQKII